MTSIRPSTGGPPETRERAVPPRRSMWRHFRRQARRPGLSRSCTGEVLPRRCGCSGAAPTGLPTAARQPEPRRTQGWYSGWAIRRTESHLQAGRKQPPWQAAEPVDEALPGLQLFRGLSFSVAVYGHDAVASIRVVWFRWGAVRYASQDRPTPPRRSSR